MNTRSLIEIDQTKQRLTEFEFIKTLRKIHTFIETGPSCFISYAWGIPEHVNLAHKMAKHLKEAGIGVSLDVWDNKAGTKISRHIEKIDESDYAILAGSTQLVKKYKAEKSGVILNLEIDQIIDKLQNNPGRVIPILLEGTKKTSFPTALGTTVYIDFTNSEIYYSQIFELLKILLQDKDLSPFEREFATQKNYIHSEKCSLEDLLQKEKNDEERDKALTQKIATNTIDDYKNSLDDNYLGRESYHKKKSIFQKIFWTLKEKIYFLVFSIILCPVVIVVYNTIIDPYEIEPTNIRSDLPLPHQGVRIERQHLITDISEKLNGEKDIETVALMGVVGMGGVGKTVLARLFARSYNSPVVWELNAETKTSLMNSFKEIAYSFAKTKEEKDSLNFIQQIQNIDDREKHLMMFIKSHLKKNPNWLLIYDNVTDFIDIKAYLPQDSKVWGNGKVIITTRDINIKNIDFIKPDAVLQIDELVEKETLELFSKIVYNKPPEKIMANEKEKIKAFLKHIPPFPLDVSAAAYYIKNYHASYEEYIEKITKNSQEFDRVQQKLLRESTNYPKTRYAIITTSLEKLISVDQNFKDLLFFMSLLDSQNIPIELLALYKTKEEANLLFDELKKNGFITSESKIGNDTPYFSIHRSTQQIMLSYFSTQQYSLKLLHSMTNILENYLANILERENLPIMGLILTHCEAFLSRKYILTEEMQEKIGNKLGQIYYYVGNYKGSEQILKKNEDILNKFSNKKNYIKIASNFGLLGDVYRMLGNYEKAEYYFRKSLEVYKNNGLTTHQEFAITLRSFSAVLEELGHYEKAKHLLEYALQIHTKYHPEDQVNTVRTIYFLGSIYRELGDYEKAREMLERSLQIYRKYYPENHGGLLRATSYLGNVYLRLGNYEKSKEMLEQNLKIYEKYYPDDHVEMAWCLMHLGNTYRKLENYEKAKEILEQSLKIYRKHYDENNANVAWVLTYLGNVYKKLGEYKKAEDTLNNCLKVYEKNYGKEHIETARVLRSIAETHFLQNNIELSEIFINKALRIFREHNHPDIHLFLDTLSDVYLAKREKSIKENKLSESEEFHIKAIACLQEALEVIEKQFSRKSPHFFKIEKKLFSIK